MRLTYARGLLNNKSNFTISIVRQQDFLPLSRFLEHNNSASVSRNFNPFPLTLETAAEISQKPHQDKYYVAFSAEEIIGLAMLRGWDEGFEVPSFGILVGKEYHHQGIGKKLTCFVLDEARNMGCKKIRLSVFASNSNAFHLYKSLGFIEVSREVVIVNGEPDIKIIMVKEMKIE